MHGLSMNEELPAIFKPAKDGGDWLCPCCNNRLATIEQLQGETFLRLADGYIRTDNNVYVKAAQVRGYMNHAERRANYHQLQEVVAEVKAQGEDPATIGIDESELTWKAPRRVKSALEPLYREKMKPSVTRLMPEQLPASLICCNCKKNVKILSIRA
jgi:hypothetical protein